MARQDGWQKTWSTKKGKGIQVKKNRKTGAKLTRDYNKDIGSKSEYGHKGHKLSNPKTRDWHGSPSKHSPHRFGSRETNKTAGGIISAVVRWLGS